MTPLPSWIDAEAWADYEAMRKRIKKPMTTRIAAQKLALLQKFKDAGHDVTAIIDAATNGHWLDFYPTREVEITTIKRRETSEEYVARVAREAAAERARVTPPPSNIAHMFARK